MYLYRIMASIETGRHEKNNFIKGYMSPPEKWMLGNQRRCTMTDIDVKENNPIYKFYFLSFFDALLAAELLELSYNDYLVSRIEMPNNYVRSYGVGYFNGIFIPEAIVDYENIFNHLCAENIKYQDLKDIKRIPDLIEKEILLEDHTILPISYCFKMKGQPKYWITYLANACYKSYRDLLCENQISIYRGIINDMVGTIQIESDYRGIKSFNKDFSRERLRIMVDTYYSREIQDFEESILDINSEGKKYYNLTLSQRKKALDASSK